MKTSKWVGTALRAVRLTCEFDGRLGNPSLPFRSRQKRIGQFWQSFVLLIGAFATVSTFAAPIMPTTDGMTWEYIMTQEAGEGFHFSDLKPDEDGKARLAVMYRIDGTQKIDGKDLLKFEMHRTGLVTNTDLVTVDEHGIVCSARIDQNGETTKMTPAQTMVAAPLKTGMSWNFDTTIGRAKVHQHYEVTGEEDVDVPAGKFRAFHIRAVQTVPNSLSIDRWFVNGVGIVKDVTAMRSNTGDLMRSVTLELKEPPKVAPRPQVKPTPRPKKLYVTIGKEVLAVATNQFSADTPKIYARWQGHDLPRQAKIRIVWIAENIGDAAPPDYTIDESTALASEPDSHGIFTLSRPDNGWAPGDYRVEFYIDDALTETVKLKITK